MKRRTLIATLVMVTALSMIACKGANEEGVMHNAQVDNAQVENDESAMRNEESGANSQGEMQNAKGDTNEEGEISNDRVEDSDSDPNYALSTPNSELKEGTPNSELKDDSELPVATATPAPTKAPSTNDNSQGDTNDESAMRNEENKDNAQLDNAQSGDNSDDNSELSIPNYELKETPTPSPTSSPLPTATPAPTATPVPNTECNHAGGVEEVGYDVKHVEIGACSYDDYYFKFTCHLCGLNWTNDNASLRDNSTHNQHKKGTDIPATCTTDGYEYGWTCDCGARNTEDSVIKARGHRTEIYQIGDKYTSTTVSGGDASGYTEWHYEEKCAISGCSYTVRDWWSTDASEAW